MAKLVYMLNQSLDGYVDHMAIGPPEEALFRHYMEYMRDLTGMVYGRRIYEVMSYWDQDLPGWDAGEREFAVWWRQKPKWVVSRTLKSVGPNATLVEGELGAAIRALKTEHAGELSVSGPELAAGVGKLGLVDEYRLYVHPVVLGSGKPFFSGALPRLRLVGSDRIAGDVVRLTYVPA